MFKQQFFYFAQELSNWLSRHSFRRLNMLMWFTEGVEMPTAVLLSIVVAPQGQVGNGPAYHYKYQT